MRFKINRDHFTSGLNKVQNIVAFRNTMPILNNVLIVADQNSNQITLTTTNLDLSISCSIKAQVEIAGAVTLPVKKLSTIIKALPQLEVQIDATSSNQVKITSGGALFKIMGLGQEDFPPIPHVQNDKSFSLKQDNLLRMIRSVSYAQSTDENRYILNGIYFKLENAVLTLVATDGKRLGLITGTIENGNDHGAILVVPSRTALELDRLLTLGETVTITHSERLISFNIHVSEESQESGLTSSVFLTSKLVEGFYPDYNQVIPKETTHRIKMDREQLLECLSRASIVTTEKSNSVKIKIADNLFQINGFSQEFGESHESIAVEFSHPKVELSFNPQFLIDPLRAITKDEVFFEFKDELAPGVLKTLDSFLCVIMPLRLG